MTHKPKDLSHEAILYGVLEETANRVKQGLKQVVVFDLDSTLFEVTPRNERILKEFIQSEHLDEHHHMRESLKKIELSLTDHGLESAVRRAGLENMPIELRDKLISFWRERFFSDDYLESDRPFEGAVDYVSELYSLGAHVYYLTGRDKVRMGVGTPKQLKTWNFPLGTERAQLIMKPVKGIDDAEFKAAQLKLIQPVQWFFENEPKIIHRVEAELPDLKIVFFESSHSGKAEPKSEWTRIRHFKR